MKKTILLSILIVVLLGVVGFLIVYLNNDKDVVNPAIEFTPTPSITEKPTDLPSPTPSPVPTATPIPSPTPEPTPTPSPSPTPSPTPEPTPTPSPTPIPTPKPTAKPTATPKPQPTQAPSKPAGTITVDEIVTVDGKDGTYVHGTFVPSTTGSYIDTNGYGWYEGIYLVLDGLEDFTGEIPMTGQAEVFAWKQKYPHAGTKGVGDSLRLVINVGDGGELAENIIGIKPAGQ